MPDKDADVLAAKARKASPDGSPATEPKAEVPSTGEGAGVAPGGTPRVASKVSYYVDPFPGPEVAVPAPFAEAVLELEKRLEVPVWLLLNTAEGSRPIDGLGPECVRTFLARRALLPEGRVALIVDSPGGWAKCAYQIAMTLRRECGAFTAVVPRYAKSAATLLVLGADTILLGDYAELGPLDAQVFDPDREDLGSALDEVQALERLHAFGLVAIDRTMFFMMSRTGKKIDTLMPLAMEFVNDLMRPLLEKIDAVHYTQTSRALKVAEEYASRLLQPRYSEDKAKKIARHLVESYPEHDFVIDAQEAGRFGLETARFPAEQAEIVDRLMPYLGSLTAIGQLKAKEEAPQ